GSIPLPADYNAPSDFVFARLMYPNGGPMDGYYPRFQGDWREGLSLWTQDYPRADRHFLEAVRRLSRIQARSVEQPVNLDEHEEYDLPFLYAVQVGEWALTEAEGKEMREYLLRGGFFMADDFHANAEYAEFVKRIRYVFPDRPIVEIPDDDPILNVVYELKERVQIPGQAHLREGCKNCNDGGRGAGDGEAAWISAGAEGAGVAAVPGGGGGAVCAESVEGAERVSGGWRAGDRQRSDGAGEPGHRGG